MTTTVWVKDNTSFSGLFQHAWDSTSLGVLKECPYKYFLKIICGWQKATMADALIFGIAFHKAMQIFHYRKAAGEDYESCLKKALAAALKAYVNNERQSHKAEKKERNLYSLMRAICWYLDTYYQEGEGEDTAVTLLLPSGKPAAELSFRFTLPDIQTPEGMEVLLCGHMDRIARHSGSNFVHDYKTTAAALGSYFFKKFNPDNQMSLYSFAGSVILDEPVSGVIVDGIKLNVHSTEFQRGFASRTKDMQQEFYEDLKFWLNLAWSFSEAKHWPMNEKSCGNYGGCEFQEVCNKPASLREGFLKSSFVRTIWDPLIERDEDSKEAAKVSEASA